MSDDGQHTHERSNGRIARGVYYLSVFALVVIIVVLASLGLLLERRNDAIENLQRSADRIEMAASHTEQILLEVVEERRSPEAIAQNDAVRRALQDIRDIKVILCGLPEVRDAIADERVCQ